MDNLRPRVGAIPLGFLTVLYLLTFNNDLFWRRGIEIFAHHELMFGALVVALISLAVAVVSIFSLRYVLKPVCVFLILVAALSSYFMDNFGISINSRMVEYAVTTTVSEAKHYLTVDFLLHMLLFGVLPSALVLLVRVKRPAFSRELRSVGVYAALGLVIAIGIVGFNYRTYASVFRERRDFMAAQNPGAAINGAVKFVLKSISEVKPPLQSIGMDARKGPHLTAKGKPVLTVVVVGETARSQNFSLNGYERNTNPALSRRDVISFTDTHSCGTATATSLPCMFSMYSRGEYSDRKGASNENLLDIMKHAGLRVEWWDNNTGSKGVADRIVYEHFNNAEDERYCHDGECNDGILVAQLRRKLGEIADDTVLVLHQIGSHGPAYFVRYPKEFEQFTPACNAKVFKDCTQAEIVNAYDNTILYTDAVLAEMIDILAAQKNLATALIYVSDHGESLGENGIYLHGLPYFMAPETQTKVPFIAWFSKVFKDQMALDTNCVRAENDKAFSHDNLFHSVLGLMEVTTSLYRQDLDLFSHCRTDQMVSTTAIVHKS